MISVWAPWVGAALLGGIVVELCRANALLAKNISREPSLDGSEPCCAVQSRPLVSIVVPAKDEECHVESCLRSILASDYTNIEVIVVDDRSTDRTAEILAAIADEDSRVKVVRVKELPADWTGKTHALYRGADDARGDVLLFSDADTLFHPQLLSRALTCFSGRELGVLGLLPGFVERGFVEKAVYPHLELGISYFYPLSDINDPEKRAALASGSFLMMRKCTYRELGTWMAFRGKLTEDVAFSRAAKASGYRLHVVRAGDMLQTRRFRDVFEMCAFWKRTYCGAFDRNVALTARLTANSVVLSILPALAIWTGYLILTGTATAAINVLFALSICAVLAVVVPFTIFIRTEGVHWAYGLTAPLGLAVASWVALSTFFTTLLNKGIRWRGSLYK
ncbi:MAG: glycosyltransferase family 2 protein [Thermodesulfobacteriota bacterium]